jgi:pyruvate,orthophosphate dikinase
VVTDADAAEATAAEGRDVVLVRPTTSPEDVHGMVVARAVVTARGGATSHAAVVSRALGLPCVVGCGDEVVAALADRAVTVDGQGGVVFDGRLPVEAPAEDDDPLLRQMTEWAREFSPLEVRDPAAALADGALDLDHVRGGELPDQLPRILRGVKGASGGALKSDEGVAAATAAGLEFIGARQKLPALLAACAASRGDGRE